MTLINYLLGWAAGTMLFGLCLVCVDDMYASEASPKQPEWKRFLQASGFIGCLLLIFMGMTSEWLNDFANTLSNTEVW